MKLEIGDRVKWSSATALRMFISGAAVVSACNGNAPLEPRGADALPGPTNTSHAFLYTTPPATETHWCQYLRLPKNDSGEVMLTGYRWTWSGLHHWSLYRTVGDLPTDIDFDHPFDCFEPGAMKYASPASLLIAGDASGDRKFPPGTGFALRSEDVVIVQAHTLNTTASVQHPTLDIDLELAGPGEVTTRLGLIQFYDPYIVVPAHTDSSAQMRCRLANDFTILRATTHQHVRGTGVRVFLDAPDGQSGAEPVLESSDWEHPTVLDSDLHVQAGSYVRTICQYLGDDHPVVVQGQDKLDNEMCMFIGFYHPMVAPDDGGGAFENCVQTPLPGGVGDAFGTGTKSCAESLSCVRSCPAGDAPRPGDGRIDVGACWQTCIANSCPAASAPLDALTYCVRQRCDTECAGRDTCNSCVAAKCGSEYAACQVQSC
jgi:hypothetical protein